MAGGFKIKAHNRKVVRIRIKTKGTYEKMVVMRISEKIRLPERATNSSSLQPAE